jgi:hypothetical protein
VIRYENYDPLSAIAWQVRSLRVPPGYHLEEQVDGDYFDEDGREIASPDDLAVWPYGLGFSVLLGAASLVVTTLRLRTPADRLPRGVRVA